MVKNVDLEDLQSVEKFNSKVTEQITHISSPTNGKP